MVRGLGYAVKKRNGDVGRRFVEHVSHRQQECKAGETSSLERMEGGRKYVTHRRL